MRLLRHPSGSHRTNDDTGVDAGRSWRDGVVVVGRVVAVVWSRGDVTSVYDHAADEGA